MLRKKKMGKKALCDWSKYDKHEYMLFDDYADYRRYYMSAYRFGRNPKGTRVFHRYILSLDCNSGTGLAYHMRYIRKAKEGLI
jgi:hypothetical protein